MLADGDDEVSAFSFVALRVEVQLRRHLVSPSIASLNVVRS
jgi:hypothetical protein